MSNPVHRLVIYRPQPGKYDALAAIVKKHGPVLRASGLLTDDPVRVYRAVDLERGGGGSAEPYLIETFSWKDDKSSDLAHQLPEVMAVWETMGPVMAELQLTTLEQLV